MYLLEQMLPLFTRNLVFKAAHTSVSYISFFFFKVEQRPAGERGILVRPLKRAGTQVSKAVLLFLNRAKCRNPATLYTKPGK